MWKALMDWLPDVHVGTIEMKDVLNIMMTVIGAYLAYLAIKMGREQGHIARRQQAIAEKQDRIMQEQLNRVPILTMHVPHQHLRHSSTDHGDPPTLARCEVLNKGSRASDGFYWELLIPRSLLSAVRFVDDGHSLLEGQVAQLPNDEEIYDRLDGHYDKRLFPRSDVAVAWLLIRPTELTRTFTLKWRVVGEDGPVPAEGFANMEFTRSSDGPFYWVSYSKPVFVAIPSA